MIPDELRADLDELTAEFGGKAVDPAGVEYPTISSSETSSISFLVGRALETGECQERISATFMPTAPQKQLVWQNVKGKARRLVDVRPGPAGEDGNPAWWVLLFGSTPDAGNVFDVPTP